MNYCVCLETINIQVDRNYYRLLPDRMYQNDFSPSAFDIGSDEVQWKRGMDVRDLYTDSHYPIMALETGQKRQYSKLSNFWDKVPFRVFSWMFLDKRYHHHQQLQVSRIWVLDYLSCLLNKNLLKQNKFSDWKFS